MVLWIAISIGRGNYEFVDLFKQTMILKSMDDSSNGRAVALYPADPGSNPAPAPYEITL